MDERMQTPGIFSPRLLIDISYFLTACLFILGLKRMSSPVTARSGIVWAGAGMVVATLVSFLYPGMSQLRADRLSYFFKACLFILGLKRRAHQMTARSACVCGCAGMAVATCHPPVPRE